ncbi:hypothetical protein H8D30_06985 [bacterium]|nr:hypothetical protein [bacterium]
MPKERERIPLEMTFTKEEAALLAGGFAPSVMEERWFVFQDGDWLRWMRSWTGSQVFKVKLVEEGSGYRVSEAWANRNKDQYLSSVKEDTALLEHLMDWLAGRLASSPPPA